MRLDRAFTLGLVGPVRRLAIGHRGSALPILMYHRVSAEPEPGLGPYYQLNVSPERFAQQMQLLAENGFQTATLGDAVNQIRAGDPIPGKQVVLTFDDGFQDFYSDAFPALSRHHFTATVFLPTDFIREPRRSFKNVACLTWQEVAELRRAGIRFGSHTVTHSKLVELPWDRVEWELHASKALLEERLSEPITTFAYPFAFPQGNRSFAKRFEQLLSDCGYKCCVTTEVGRVLPGDDLFRLKRLPVNSLDDPALFLAKLEGSYDWLGVPQSVAKAVKGFIRKGPPAARTEASAL